MRKHLLTLGSGYVSTSRGRCSLWPAFKPTKRGTLQRHKSVRSINWQSFCMSPLLPLCEGSLFWTMRAVFVLPRSDGPGKLFHVFQQKPNPGVVPIGCANASGTSPIAFPALCCFHLEKGSPLQATLACFVCLSVSLCVSLLKQGRLLIQCSNTHRDKVEGAHVLGSPNEEA